MTNRHLVPMPTSRPTAPAPMRPAAQPPPIPVTPPEPQAWRWFGFMIAATFVLYYIPWPLTVLIGILAGVSWGIFWLVDRYPRTVLAVSVFINVFSRRRW